MFMAIVVVEELSKNDILKAREEYFQYIKITVDISKKIVAIGGEYHADAEDILIKNFKCRNENIWGGGYNIKLKRFEANAVLNIKPQINDSLEIIAADIRNIFFEIVEEKLKNIETFL